MQEKSLNTNDLEERLVKWRPMTAQEIENFGVIPDGATKYKNLKSYQTACKKLNNITYEAGSNPDKGLFWTFVK